MDQAKTPMHLWVVGVLATLWNGFGGYLYWMSRSGDEAFLRKAAPDVDPAAAVAYMESMPVWASFGWGLGVWSALLASLLLLMRNRFAVPLFAASIVGMILSFGYQFLISAPPAGMDDKVMPTVIFLVGVALFFYARAMRAKGALR